jgi:isoleucyl-tRNA synthetase
MARYKEFRQLNLPAIEKEVLARWEEEQAFQKSVSLRDGAPPFVFYEGPRYRPHHERPGVPL